MNQIKLSLISLLTFFTVLAQTENPHKNLNQPCQDCHTTAGWIPIKATPKFDHSQTGFNLDGQHKNNVCSDCHTSLTFSEVKNTCASCHMDVHQEKLGPDCQSCHTAESWDNQLQMRASHQLTRFPLQGLHAGVACEDCHQGSVESFFMTAMECESCHINEFREAKDPDHVAAGFPHTCDTCHDVIRGWNQANFDHNITQFPLTGAHQPLDCSACHESGFSGTPTDCFACHELDYNQSEDPNHLASNFPTSCQDCHTPAAWMPAQFDHNITQFPLTGAHQPLDCSACHESGFSGTPTDCFACHELDYNQSEDPNHLASNFPTSCQDCHTPAAWMPAQFDHNITQFPLTGAHQPLDCSACHESGFSGTPTDCFACHELDYNQSEDPNHPASNFPTSCQDCHTPAAWMPAQFDHNITQFPLTGAHQPLDCSACHESGFSGTPTDCFACHELDYNQSEDPNHLASNFPTSCQDCHTPAAWMPAQFDHNITQFPLTGAHQPLDCSACHESGFSGTPTDCFACHELDYNQSEDPNHLASNFPTSCQDCHTPAAWMPAQFDHNITQFPLTGAHQPLDCSACHESGFSGTPTDCFACHELDYNQSEDPNHLASNFPTSCQDCHTPAAWMPAQFDHNITQFPLTGAHQPLDCSACHESGFSGTPTDCFVCHQLDYNQAQDPNHAQAGFPTTCQDCHSSAAWEPSNFMHMFPIYSGEHAGEWDSCSTCHIQPSQFSVFSCLDCHEHSQSEMDDEHDDVMAYVYESNACYTCHPDGRE